MLKVILAMDVSGIAFGSLPENLRTNLDIGSTIFSYLTIEYFLNKHQLRCSTRRVNLCVKYFF